MPLDLVDVALKQMIRREDLAAQNSSSSSFCLLSIDLIGEDGAMMCMFEMVVRFEFVEGVERPWL